MIFYEAPHHLKKTLQELAAVLGDRKITLCRELTKRFETVMPTTIFAATDYFETNDPRGEYVLVIEGKKLRGKEAGSTEKLAGNAGGGTCCTV